METKQVLDALKPKAASFGFSEEELNEASKTIAGLHPEEATEEEVAKVVDNHLPFLKLSQSAANRSFERMKAQFEKEHPKKTPEQEEAERKAKEEAERKKKEEDARKKALETEPEYLKKYREETERRLKALEDENKSLKEAKTNEDFRKSAVTALEGVDESYYSLMLEQQKFSKQEDVDNFVAKVKEGWEKLSKNLNINNLSRVKPPKGGAPAADKPSQEVQDRIERRKKSSAAASPIRGIEQK